MRQSAGQHWGSRYQGPAALCSTACRASISDWAVAWSRLRLGTLPVQTEGPRHGQTSWPDRRATSLKGLVMARRKGHVMARRHGQTEGPRHGRATSWPDPIQPVPEGVARVRATDYQACPGSQDGLRTEPRYLRALLDPHLRTPFRPPHRPANQPLPRPCPYIPCIPPTPKPATGPTFAPFALYRALVCLSVRNQAWPQC